MTFSSHAIRRYKKRVGKKTTSRKRVIAQMHKDLKTDVKYRKPSRIPLHYILVTSKYQAVCCRHNVVTILHLDVDAAKMTMKELKEELEESA